MHLLQPCSISSCFLSEPRSCSTALPRHTHTATPRPSVVGIISSGCTLPHASPPPGRTNVRPGEYWRGWRPRYTIPTSRLFKCIDRCRIPMMRLRCAVQLWAMLRRQRSPGRNLTTALIAQDNTLRIALVDHARIAGVTSLNSANTRAHARDNLCDCPLVLEEDPSDRNTPRCAELSADAQYPVCRAGTSTIIGRATENESSHRLRDPRTPTRRNVLPLSTSMRLLSGVCRHGRTSGSKSAWPVQGAIHRIARGIIRTDTRFGQCRLHYTQSRSVGRAFVRYLDPWL